MEGTTNFFTLTSTGDGPEWISELLKDAAFRILSKNLDVCDITFYDKGVNGPAVICVFYNPRLTSGTSCRAVS